MRRVKCPSCKKEIEYSEKNTFRPFCSERCKILDLGDWAMEKHAIPEVEPESKKIEKDEED
jgi:uncharacterized protein